MKIKRYMAVSMRAALAQVRAEQGPDAVILSSRRVEEGIEVIAAVDYDEALFVGATQKRAPAVPPDIAAKPTGTPAQPVMAAPPVVAAAVIAAPPVGAAAPLTRTSQPIIEVQAPAAAAPPAKRKTATALDDGYLAVQAELKDLRELLQGELAHMSWNDKRLREPLQARVLEQLTAMDIAPDIAMSLASRAPRRTNLKSPANIHLALLVRNLRVVDKLS